MNENETVEQLKQELKLILSLIDDGVVIVDTTQKVSYINKAAESILGVSFPEVMAKNVGDALVILNKDNNPVSPSEYCPVGEIDIDGAVYRGDSTRVVDKQDKVKNIYVESRKMRGGSQVGVGCVIILKNVETKTELEKMKVDFTSMAVHVLRTPITILKGYLGSLLRDETKQKLNEDEWENLTSAVEGANNLGKLIEDILHLSDIQQGKFKLYPTPINYEGLVFNAVSTFQKKAAEKGITLIYNPPIYSFPMTRIDVERIKELLSNIIGNAVKFTDRGFVEVKLSHDDKFITTVVADTGRGIPREKISMVFQKFYHEKDNPLSMSEGNGMSLFISQKIVEAHKGKIWVESKEGIGSSFFFTLPIIL